MNNIKRYLVFFIGLMTLGFGISFSINSAFGSGPMAVLVCGLFNVLPFSMGTCNLIVGAIQLIIGTALDRSHTTLVSLLALFITSYSIDFANLFIVPSDSIATRIIYLFAGVILYCLGIAMQQSASIGLDNLDIFIFGIKKLLKIDKYHIVRWIVDIFSIVVGLLLKATASYGTLLLVIFSGILIERLKILTDKLI